MPTPTGTCHANYLVPPRTIAGSTSEMFAQIDEAVQALLALRHLIAVEHATPRHTRAEGASGVLRLVVPQGQSAESAKR